MLKLSNLASTETRIVRQKFSFVMIKKAVVYFSAAFYKDYLVFFLTAWMVDIGKGIALSYFLTGSWP